MSSMPVCDRVMRLYVQTDSRLQQREGEIFDDNFPGLVILEWEFAFMKIKPKRRICYDRDCV
eukprot:UN4747